VSVPIEVTVVRLYTKTPGSEQLRKNAAAELATLLAAGWHEKQRKTAPDHLVIRLERPRPALVPMPVTAHGGPRPPRR